MEKVYRGSRNQLGPMVTCSDGDEFKTLLPRNDLRDMSPDGFEWGYPGSGPVQLALAILADYFGDDEKALAYYQRFKFQVVTRLPKEGWTLTSEQIESELHLMDVDLAFKVWVDHAAHRHLGLSGRATIRVIETKPKDRMALLDAEGLYSPQWVEIPEGIPVPEVTR